MALAIMFSTVVYCCDEFQGEANQPTDAWEDGRL